MKENSLLKVSNLRKWFPVRRELVESILRFRGKEKSLKAVDDVSFEVKRGEILGLVGESGCGKTTIGRLILKLIAATDGKVFFEGNDVFSIKTRKELLRFRREIQMIFQDPYECLSPRLSVHDLISEPLAVHKIPTSEREKMVMEMLETTGLPWTKEFMRKRPSNLSGGQRQRVAIARSLILRPKFIVADEPVSMLDASIKGSILRLMLHLKERFAVTYLLITHDLSIAWHLCDRIAVMYLGKIVEEGPIEVVVKNPLHPYARALMTAVPTTDLSTKSYLHIDENIYGQIPTPINPPSGCRFHPRCPSATDLCSREEPKPIKVKKGHEVRCHLVV
jgi:peptide/nickel transport system ATP-binding protein